MWYSIIPCATKKNPATDKSAEPSLLQWNRRINELFDPFFESFPSLDASWKGLRTPALDVVENEKEFRVSADFPGFSEKEVQVRLDGNSLVIEGNKTEEQEAKNSEYRWNERRAGRLERVLSLPEGRVDKEKISAVLKNGVLNIILPKVEGVSSKKTIEIKAG